MRFANSVVLLAGKWDACRNFSRIQSLRRNLEALGASIQIVSAEEDERPGDVPELPERTLLAWGKVSQRDVRTLNEVGSLPRPALIHALEVSLANLAAALSDHWCVPYVLTVDDFVPVGGRLRVNLRWCRGLVAPSTLVATDLIQAMGVPQNLVSVVPASITLPATCRLGTGIGPEHGERASAVVGTRVRSLAASGLDTFFAAARKVLDAGADAEFLVACQGRGQASYRGEAERLGIGERLTFAPGPSFGEPFWSVLDVYCQPARTASVGTALLQSLACGLPSIASDVPGLRSLVDHGVTGFLVPPGEPEALGAAILTLLSNPHDGFAMGRRGRECIAVAFPPGEEARQLAALYERVAESADTDRLSVLTA
jgi:glycosyltransferase involved in cell wall biosynthesis